MKFIFLPSRSSDFSRTSPGPPSPCRNWARRKTANKDSVDSWEEIRYEITYWNTWEYKWKTWYELIDTWPSNVVEYETWICDKQCEITKSSTGIKIKINEELGLWNSWKVILTGIVRWCLWSEIVNEVKIRYDVKTGVYELTWNEMWAQKEIACEKEDPIGACNNWILDSWEECDGWYNLQNYKTWIF